MGLRIPRHGLSPRDQTWGERPYTDTRMKIRTIINQNQRDKNKRQVERAACICIAPLPELFFDLSFSSRGTTAHVEGSVMENAPDSALRRDPSVRCLRVSTSSVSITQSRTSSSVLNSRTATYLSFSGGISSFGSFASGTASAEEAEEEGDDSEERDKGDDAGADDSE